MNNVQTKPETTGIKVRDEEGNFLFQKDWLKQYSIIDGPGTYAVQVTSEPQLYNPAEYGEEGNPRYIVNVKAILESDLKEMASILKGKEYVRADAISSLLMNGNIWVNEGASPVIPHRGQMVEITVGHVENREGEEVLRITGVFPQAPKTAKKVNLDALFADERLDLDEIE